jgi:hypothetical protein
MNNTDRSYGSQYHFQWYRDNDPQSLDNAISSAIKSKTSALLWRYPTSPATDKEPTGISFLSSTREIREAWVSFWPSTGTPPAWDGIAARTTQAGREWIIIEAKANHPEFCSPPSGAGTQSRKLICESLKKTQRYLGVHPAFSWLGTYYQYANRLAFLYFLNAVVHIPARLVFLYFTGDQFPDERPCPATIERWNELIRACHLTLGLPDEHALSDRVHTVFLPCESMALRPTDLGGTGR